MVSLGEVLYSHTISHLFYFEIRNYSEPLTLLSASETKNCSLFSWNCSPLSIYFANQTSSEKLKILGKQGMINFGIPYDFQLNWSWFELFKNSRTLQPAFWQNLRTKPHLTFEWNFKTIKYFWSHLQYDNISMCKYLNRGWFNGKYLNMDTCEIVLI